MTHVVAEPCRDCTGRPCVAVCPNDCFHEGGQMLYIYSGGCIDCAACVPECPANAIFHEDHLPGYWRPYRDLNLTLSRQSKRLRREGTSFGDSRFEIA